MIKRSLTILFTLAVVCSLSLPVFAMMAGGDDTTKTPANVEKTKVSKTVTTEKIQKTDEKDVQHKGGKKGKKSSGGTTSQAPK